MVLDGLTERLLSKYILPNHFLYILACLVLCQIFFGVACSSDTHKDSPEATANVGDVGHDSSRDIDISEDTTRIARLILSPDPVEIIATQTVQVSFRAYNSEGLELTDVLVVWHIEDAQATSRKLLYACRGCARG